MLKMPSDIKFSLTATIKNVETININSNESEIILNNNIG